jgi:hypothetical protein
MRTIGLLIFKPAVNIKSPLTTFISRHYSNMPQFSGPIAIIQGVGPGTGASIARKFAQKYVILLQNLV